MNILNIYYDTLRVMQIYGNWEDIKGNCLKYLVRGMLYGTDLISYNLLCEVIFVFNLVLPHL
jgi:hypothetical protein